MAKKTRIKAPAAPAPQTDEEADNAIREIGNVQRIVAKIEADMIGRLSDLKSEYEAEAAPSMARLTELRGAVQTYCEANRGRLTRNGRRKTVKFPAGKVEWRARPPSVSLRGVGDIIKHLKDSPGLRRFLRIKEEVNKEALLAEPRAAAGIEGVTIKSGLEDFAITPFGAELDGGGQ